MHNAFRQTEFLITVVETDYDTYSASVFCDGEQGTPYPVISSVNKKMEPGPLLDRLKSRFTGELGIPVHNFDRVMQHNRSCQYDFEGMLGMLE